MVFFDGLVADDVESCFIVMMLVGNEEFETIGSLVAWSFPLVGVAPLIVGMFSVDICCEVEECLIGDEVMGGVCPEGVVMAGSTLGGGRSLVSDERSAEGIYKQV